MAYVHNNLLSSLPQTRRGGPFALLQLPERGGSRLSIFTAFPKTTSVPPGYAPRGAFVLPYTAGDMAALVSAVSLSGSGNVIRGGPLVGTGTLELTGGGGLSLTVGLQGDGSLSFAGDGGLALTIGMAGDGTITMTGTGALAMIVPFAGSGAFSIAGTGNLKGRLSLAGEFTPFTELSPESLAAAVWNSNAADFDQTGSMGEKLNDAGSAANPWTEVIESGYSAAEILRLIAATVQGNAEGLESGAPVFKGLDGTTTRITATYSGGTRVVTSRDAS